VTLIPSHQPTRHIRSFWHRSRLPYQRQIYRLVACTKCQLYANWIDSPAFTGAMKQAHLTNYTATTNCLADWRTLFTCNQPGRNLISHVGSNWDWAVYTRPQVWCQGRFILSAIFLYSDSLFDFKMMTRTIHTIIFSFSLSLSLSLSLFSPSFCFVSSSPPFPPPTPPFACERTCYPTSNAQYLLVNASTWRPIPRRRSTLDDSRKDRKRERERKQYKRKTKRNKIMRHIKVPFIFWI